MDTIPVGKESHIYPLTTDMPARLSDELVLSHETPAEVVQLIREGLLSQTVLWSCQESARISGSTRPEGGHAASPTREMASPLSRVVPVHPIPPGGGEGNSVVTEAEEEKALDLLFGDVPASTGNQGSLHLHLSLKDISLLLRSHPHKILCSFR